MLEHTRVLDMSRLSGDRVQLLSRVKLTNLDSGTQMTYTLVSTHEANLREGKISVNSPIAKALIGGQVGDVVEVVVPAGLLKLRIDGISIA